MREVRMPIDAHSHVLPGLDDGSASVGESLEMLSLSRTQGVQAMIATPHFYPEKQALNDFLIRRRAAMQALLDGGYDESVHPRLYVGAEVAYFHGIGRCDDIDRLRVLGTRVVLVEMPCCPWTSRMIGDVVMLRERAGLIPVLAHIDRYDEMRNRKMLEELLSQGVLLQISAQQLDRFWTRRRACRMIANDIVQLIGSDCHNMKTRKPNMDVAYAYLNKRAPFGLSARMAEYDCHLLRGAQSLREILECE